LRLPRLNPPIVALRLPTIKWVLEKVDARIEQFAIVAFKTLNVGGNRELLTTLLV
jgi:hypothetical protein